MSGHETAGRWSEFQRTKAYDVLAALPLIAFYLFAFSGLVLRFGKDVSDVASGYRGAASLLALLLDLVTAVYIVTTVFVIAVRKIPVAKSYGVKPRLIALVATNLQLSLFVLPHAAISDLAAAVSLGIATIGTGAEIAILVWLRHAFSIFPEARKLVTNGPYRWVRHPIYLVGTISSFGLCMQYEQPWALLITLATFAFQLWRMQCEEAVLIRTFPEYAVYARNTARLIPAIY